MKKVATKIFLNKDVLIIGDNKKLKAVIKPYFVYHAKMQFLLKVSSMNY